jgi:hypothetical protein
MTLKPQSEVIMRSLMVILLLGLGGWALALPVPTTLNDFFLPGSQPNESGNIEKITRCSNCHGGYGQIWAEPVFNWQGSMMAQAMRDPFFFACLTIANQDAPQSGDLCIRCHAPAGWLEGRSVPTDGSALTADDRQGIQCDFCHRNVKPSPIGTNPYPADSVYTADTYPLDQTYLGTITAIPPQSGNGGYVVDSDVGKRGPFAQTVARHTYYYSPFHRDANLCGTCHDVSNPAFTRQPDDRYVPNAFDSPSPSFDTHSMFPIERTFSEWLMSAYNTPEGVYAPQFGGNLDTVRTCQDCHLRDVTGKGCDKADAQTRSDLPLHDLTGGNTTVPQWVAQAYPTEVTSAALDSGILRARYMLRHAASLSTDLTWQDGVLELHVRVINETGHKLPSGYPEGRRMWLNVRAYDIDSLLIYESGAYDTATAVLSHDPDAKIYETEPGISPALSPVVGLAAGPSFHFVVNDTVYKDNRIPPRGFTNANYAAVQSPPVGCSYVDGQYWDDTQYGLPTGTAFADVVLYYQTTRKEYIEFLRDANVTNTAGQTAYNLWAANGRSRPEWMGGYRLVVPSPPLQPVTSLVIQVVNGDIRLSWPPAAGATEYRVYRFSTFEASQETWEQLDIVTDTFYTETVPAASRGFYAVVAVNDAP